MTQPQSLTRDELLAELQQACSIFEAFSLTTEREVRLKTMVIHEVPMRAPLPPEKPWKGPGKFLLACVISFLIILFLLAPLFKVLVQFLWLIVASIVAAIGGFSVYEPAPSDWVDTLMFLKDLTEIFALVTITIAGAFLINALIKRIVRKKIEKVEATNAQIESDNANAMEAAVQNNKNVAENLNAVAHELEAIRVQWASEIKPWWPPHYQSLDAARFFLKVVANYQADSLKEAVNLYEEHLHRNRMEAEMARQTELSADLNKTMDERLEEIGRFTKISALTGAVSAIANVGTAFNTSRIAGSAAATASNTAATAQSASRAARSAQNAASSLNSINSKLR